MNYNQTLEYLFSALPMYQRIGAEAYKADLENAERFDDYFNQPHKSFKCIHVAGTNGKGSVSHMLAATLQSNGYKTGLYTSPHLLDFRERIKINGDPIPEQFVIDFTHNHKKLFSTVQPSFFEMSVFMAFDYFRSENVDIAVIEVGLGGRLDTTNIIHPILSIITNIGYDHTQFLGNTLDKIAFEKAGIIKPKIPVIIGETQIETQLIFEEIANKNESKITFADQLYHIDFITEETEGKAHYYFGANHFLKNNKVILDLKGHYQKKNLVTVCASIIQLKNLGLRLNTKNILAGLKNVVGLTGLQGRWMEVGQNPLVICDTAHNTEGITEAILQLTGMPIKQLHIILGFVNDKNLKLILGILPVNAQYYLCEPDIPRAKKVEELAQEFSLTNLRFTTHNTVTDAFTLAMQVAHPHDVIFLGGSTFVVADFMKWKKSEKTF